jgi:hypothetical protein
MALHGISIKPSHKGLLHKDLGKKPGAKLSEKDLAKAKNSKDPAERKRATFAENARKWNKGGKKSESKSRADRMYGKEKS